jgi:anthranilate phosphoribosyltransferase
VFSPIGSSRYVVLGQLGSTRVWTVHGSDGLDEITTTGPTEVAAFENGRIRRFTIDPRDFGIALARADDLKGGDPADNAVALRAVLDGAKTPYRDVAVLNAAAALVVAEAASDLKEGVARALAAVESGAARGVLDRLASVSNG